MNNSTRYIKVKYSNTNGRVDEQMEILTGTFSQQAEQLKESVAKIKRQGYEFLGHREVR